MLRPESKDRAGLQSFLHLIHLTGIHACRPESGHTQSLRLTVLAQPRTELEFSKLFPQAFYDYKMLNGMKVLKDSGAAKWVEACQIELHLNM